MNVADGTRVISQPIAFQEPALTIPEDAAARESRVAALVHRQSRFVFRIAYALLRNTHDAEDVVQETFLKLYSSGAWEQMNDERAFLARMRVERPDGPWQHLGAWLMPEQEGASAQTAGGIEHHDATPRSVNAGQ